MEPVPASLCSRPPAAPALSMTSHDLCFGTCVAHVTAIPLAPLGKTKGLRHAGQSPRGVLSVLSLVFLLWGQAVWGSPFWVPRAESTEARLRSPALGLPHTEGHSVTSSPAAHCLGRKLEGPREAGKPHHLALAQPRSARSKSCLQKPPVCVEVCSPALGGSGGPQRKRTSSARVL